MEAVLLKFILPALLPALSDGLRGLFARVTQGRGALPQSIDDVIRLMEAQTARLQALAALDAASGNISRWVADLRGAFRYIVVSFVIVTTVLLMVADAFGAAVDADALLVMLDMSGACMMFIIGERMYLAVRR